MSVCSLGFLLFCIAVVLIGHAAPGKRLRHVILAAANAVFLVSLVPNQRSATWFAAVLAGSYLVLWLVHKVRRGEVLAAAILLSILVLLYVNRFEFVATWVAVPSDWNLILHPVQLVGLSYMVFKLIHMLVDERQGQLAPFSLWSYLNYQLAFFTLIAGPLQRYNDFERNWNEMGGRAEDPRENSLLWQRLLVGMIKIGLLGAWARSAMPQYPVAEQVTNPGTLLLWFYLYPLYLYLNFSGYTDVMIGVAGLLGFQLPENFNYPYLARNMLDFWGRWHISLTNWIRDYVFMSSYKMAATHSPETARFSSYVLLFLALFLAGVWHGAAYGFVAFGVLNGLGAAVTHGYGEALRAALGRAGLQAYLRSRAIRGIARLATLHYVCFCHLFFYINDTHPSVLLKAMGRGFAAMPAFLATEFATGRAAMVLVAAALLLAALWNADAIGSGLCRLGSRIVERTALLRGGLCVLTVAVVVALYIDWTFQQNPPPVLYMSF